MTKHYVLLLNYFQQGVKNEPIRYILALYANKLDHYSLLNKPQFKEILAQQSEPGYYLCLKKTVALEYKLPESDLIDLSQ